MVEYFDVLVFRLEIGTFRKHIPAFLTGPVHGDLLSVVVPLIRLDPEPQQRQIWNPTEIFTVAVFGDDLLFLVVIAQRCCQWRTSSTVFDQNGSKSECLTNPNQAN